VPDADVLGRLAALPTLAALPRAELEWLVAHGQPSRGEAGDLLARKGEPIDHLSILLEGHVAVRVDREPVCGGRWNGGRETRRDCCRTPA